MPQIIILWARVLNSFQSTSVLIQPILQQLVFEDLTGDRAKSLPQDKVLNVHCSPLIYPLSHFILEDSQSGQAWLPLCESLLTILTTFLSVRCLETVSKISYSRI